MDLWTICESQIEGKNRSIVYPEGEDIRILGAAARHQRDGILVPILIGQEEKLKALAAENDIDLGDIQIIDPLEYEKMDEMVAAFVERRKGKATEDEAREILKDVNYFGTMLVQMGLADGMVSGATRSTGDTVRPALQIIKTEEGVSRVSGAMIVMKDNERLYFADIAINPELDRESLAEVAVISAKNARFFGIRPKVAMLSFSSKGSASGPECEKMAGAAKLAQELDPRTPIDGELQFDAAYVESVAAQKAPGSDVAGQANVFIFPNLEAGNIGYKIAQRLGGYEAIGPILQGLAKPINDLSRGCSEEDAYKLAIITANQAT